MKKTTKKRKKSVTGILSNLEQYVMREEIKELIMGDCLILLANCFTCVFGDIREVKGPCCCGDLYLYPWLKAASL